MKVQRARGVVVPVGVKEPSGLWLMEFLVTGMERVRQQKARKLALTTAVRLNDFELAFLVFEECLKWTCRLEKRGLSCLPWITGRSVDLHEMKGMGLYLGFMSKSRHGDDSIKDTVAKELKALV